MFIVTILVIAICRVQIKRAMNSRCSQPNRIPCARRSVPLYDLDVYLNRTTDVNYPGGKLSWGNLFRSFLLFFINKNKFWQTLSRTDPRKISAWTVESKNSILCTNGEKWDFFDEYWKHTRVDKISTPSPYYFLVTYVISDIFSIQAWSMPILDFKLRKAEGDFRALKFNLRGASPVNGSKNRYFFSSLFDYICIQKYACKISGRNSKN